MPQQEFELIERYLNSQIGQPRADVIQGIGDDGAIVQPQARQRLVISCDSMLENVHFFNDTSAEIIGYRSLAGAISDLLAMGATPCWASLSLSMPEPDGNWLSQLCKGFNELLKEANMQLIGGDLCRGSKALTWQVLGQADQHHLLYRNQAKVGQLLAVTGKLGGAAAYCQYRLGNIALPPAAAQNLQSYWAHPSLPWTLALQLTEATQCAIDLSDGLLPDLQHITQASFVGADIWADCLPIPELVQHNCSKQQALQLALTGGEDYQLLVTLPPESEHLASQLTVIGKITPQNQGLRLLTQRKGSQLDWPESCFRHF